MIRRLVIWWLKHHGWDIRRGLADSGSSVTNGINLQRAIDTAPTGIDVYIEVGVGEWGGKLFLPTRPEGQGTVYIRGSK